jgi:hypothetical protein
MARERREESAPCTTATSSSSFTSWFTQPASNNNNNNINNNNHSLTLSCISRGESLLMKRKDHVFHFFFTSLVVITSPIHCRKRFFSLTHSLSLSATIIHSTFDCVVVVVVVSARRDFRLFLGTRVAAKKK